MSPHKDTPVALRPGKNAIELTHRVESLSGKPMGRCRRSLSSPAKQRRSCSDACVAPSSSKDSTRLTSLLPSLKEASSLSLASTNPARGCPASSCGPDTGRVSPLSGKKKKKQRRGGRPRISAGLHLSKKGQLQRNAVVECAFESPRFTNWVAPHRHVSVGVATRILWGRLPPVRDSRALGRLCGDSLSPSQSAASPSKSHASIRGVSVSRQGSRGVPAGDASRSLLPFSRVSLPSLSPLSSSSSSVLSVLSFASSPALAPRVASGTGDLCVDADEEGDCGEAVRTEEKEATSGGAEQVAVESGAGEEGKEITRKERLERDEVTGQCGHKDTGRSPNRENACERKQRLRRSGRNLVSGKSSHFPQQLDTARIPHVQTAARAPRLFGLHLERKTVPALTADPETGRRHLENVRQVPVLSGTSLSRAGSCAFQRHSSRTHAVPTSQCLAVKTAGLPHGCLQLHARGKKIEKKEKSGTTCTARSPEGKRISKDRPTREIEEPGQRGRSEEETIPTEKADRQKECSGKRHSEVDDQGREGNQEESNPKVKGRTEGKTQEKKDSLSVREVRDLRQRPDHSLLLNTHAVKPTEKARSSNSFFPPHSSRHSHPASPESVSDSRAPQALSVPTASTPKLSPVSPDASRERGSRVARPAVATTAPSDFEAEKATRDPPLATLKNEAATARPSRTSELSSSQSSPGESKRPTSCLSARICRSTLRLSSDASLRACSALNASPSSLSCSLPASPSSASPSSASLSSASPPSSPCSSPSSSFSHSGLSPLVTQRGQDLRESAVTSTEQRRSKGGLGGVKKSDSQEWTFRRDRTERKLARLEQSRYFTFKHTKVDGKLELLENRRKVLEALHVLHTLYGSEICRRFGLRYTFLAEHHPTEKKAGITVKKPMQTKILNDGETPTVVPRSLATIRLRLRKREEVNELISRSTQLAVFFHELAHLRHMNHGKDFARFLRDIFSFAASRGLVEQGMTNELPSPWKWEREVFDRAGNLTDAEIDELFEQDEKAMEAANLLCCGNSQSASAPPCDGPASRSQNLRTHGVGTFSTESGETATAPSSSSPSSPSPSSSLSSSLVSQVSRQALSAGKEATGRGGDKRDAGQTVEECTQGRGLASCDEVVENPGTGLRKEKPAIVEETSSRNHTLTPDLGKRLASPVYSARRKGEATTSLQGEVLGKQTENVEEGPRETQVRFLLARIGGRHTEERALKRKESAAEKKSPNASLGNTRRPVFESAASPRPLISRRTSREQKTKGFTTSLPSSLESPVAGLLQVSSSFDCASCSSTASESSSSDARAARCAKPAGGQGATQVVNPGRSEGSRAFLERV
ncbi:WLM domain protein [Toxoplasma gondii MAS]|uniref:WLM domain protein n=1 Tax=Toxoplasma gondii MAS TaxID=943118 RepID=A0A086PQ73_TOXGO|nr:WLM domain protein [Toxoplasma gondii MAS]